MKSDYNRKFLADSIVFLTCNNLLSFILIVLLRYGIPYQLSFKVNIDNITHGILLHVKFSINISSKFQEASTRKIEHFVSQKRGFQMLYGDTYVTLEEFRRMFDHTVYDKLRNSLPYCKEAFPEIYGKVNKSVRV